MKKLILILMIIAAGVAVKAQNNVPVCAADTTIRTNGDTLINEVFPSVGKIDNKNFKINMVQRTRINNVVIQNTTEKGSATFNLDSSYYIFHEGAWHWYTGEQIQQAVAPVETNLLISLGRNIYYQTKQDSLWIPRTY